MCCDYKYALREVIAWLSFSICFNSNRFSLVCVKMAYLLEFRLKIFRGTRSRRMLVTSCLNSITHTPLIYRMSRSKTFFFLFFNLVTVLEDQSPRRSEHLLTSSDD